jgi:integrase
MSSKKKQPKAKEPVKIRFKKLANGNQSIYLARWNGDKWDYEFLKELYIIPEKTPADKDKNTETLRLANAVKAQKIVELQNTAHGFSMSAGRSKVNFLDYIQSIADKKRDNATKKGRDKRSSGYDQYRALYSHIQQYSGIKTTFKQVDKKYCEGFIEYLKTAKSGNNKSISLNENTQFGLLRMLGYVLNYAVSDEVTNINPLKQIKTENKPKKHAANVCFLTVEELQALTAAPTLPNIKSTFLFSCYSGLRFSDVKGLTWGKLQKDNEGKTYINFTQKKTQKQEYLPLAQKAIQFLPLRPAGVADTDLIFSIPSNGYVNAFLKQWAIAAGIKKHLTFHVARHTNATLLLSLDVPIETVSKMLGHSDIQTTQIYAKVINKSMQAAADKLDSI